MMGVKSIYIRRFSQSILNFRIVAHRNLCLQMFEGKHFISILKIWAQKCL